MSDKEILTKAVRKAIKNGYREDVTWPDDNNGKAELLITSNNWIHLVFDHQFAKAFFGEKDMWPETDCTCGGAGIHANDDMHHSHCARVLSERGYKYHLQRMVLEENPIKYLEKFL